MVNNTLYFHRYYYNIFISLKLDNYRWIKHEIAYAAPINDPYIKKVLKDYILTFDIYLNYNDARYCLNIIMD